MAHPEGSQLPRCELHGRTRFRLVDPKDLRLLTVMRMSWGADPRVKTRGECSPSAALITALGETLTQRHLEDMPGVLNH